MSQFNFRLEKVLKHRKGLVDRNSLQVAKADRRVARLARNIVELEGNITRQHRAMAPCEGQRLQASKLIAGTAWLDHLQLLRNDMEDQLDEATRDLVRFRSRLTESWRDLEVFSRLKDRQEAGWRTNLDRREIQEADEIGQVCRGGYSQVKVTR